MFHENGKRVLIIWEALSHFLLWQEMGEVEGGEGRRRLHIAEVRAKFFTRVSQWRLAEYACGGATPKLNKKLYNHLVLREIKAREE